MDGPIGRTRFSHGLFGVNEHPNMQHVTQHGSGDRSVLKATKVFSMGISGGRGEVLHG